MRIYLSVKKFLFCILFFLLIYGVALAEIVSVSVSVANIRSGPGAKNDVLWQVEKYHPIKIIKSSGSWYKFSDFEDDKGWINKKLVNKTETVITIKDSCRVRSKPGKKGKILFTVERGIPFKVLKHKGNWINIRHADGDTGWIYKTLVWGKKI